MTELPEAAKAAARSRVYAFLAETFAEPDAATLARLKETLPATEAALALIGATESTRALAALGSEIGALSEAELAAAHRRVFGLGVSGDCPPYEGEYGQAHIFQKTQCLADNAGFLRAFGLTASPAFKDRLDHVSVELEFLHVLAAKEAYALAQGHGEERLSIVRDAARKYLKHHLGRWAPHFAARLEQKAQSGPYAALARLLSAFVAEETRAHEVAPVSVDAAGMLDPQLEEPIGCEGCPASAVFNPGMGGAG